MVMISCTGGWGPVLVLIIVAQMLAQGETQRRSFSNDGFSPVVGKPSIQQLMQHSPMVINGIDIDLITVVVVVVVVVGIVAAASSAK